MVLRPPPTSLELELYDGPYGMTEGDGTLLTLMLVIFLLLRCTFLVPNATSRNSIAELFLSPEQIASLLFLDQTGYSYVLDVGWFKSFAGSSTCLFGFSPYLGGPPREYYLFGLECSRPC
jgi:hypothetical protein